MESEINAMYWLKKQRNNYLDNWYSVNGVSFFIVLSIIYIVLFLLKRMLIIDGIAAFEILQERGEMWVFDLFFGLKYISIPVFLAWKFTLTTFLIWVGCFMFGYRLTFSQLWKMVMIFDLIFIIPELLKIVWFGLVASDDPSYHDYVAFYPLSMMNFFDHTILDDKWHYPLKALNIFELIYWLLLVTGVFWISGKKLVISFYAVFSSYVFIFFVWLIYYTLVFK